MFENHVVAGIEVLVKFSSNFECLLLQIVIATQDKGVVILESLVPRGIGKEEDLPISEEHKRYALSTLKRWIKNGLLKPSEYDSLKIRYHSSRCRGYATFWKLDRCLPISSVDLLDDYCRNSSINVIEERPAPYFSDAEQKDFARRVANWRRENQQYLRNKAKEFADFWAGKLGTFKSAGDSNIDFLGLVVSSNSESLSETDRERFWEAVYKFAIEKLEERSSPFLSTDYGPDYRLRDILEKSNLMHLARSLPFKAHFHLDFSDLDLTALLRA